MASLPVGRPGPQRDGHLCGAPRASLGPTAPMMRAALSASGSQVRTAPLRVATWTQLKPTSAGALRGGLSFFFEGPECPSGDWRGLGPVTSHLVASEQPEWFPEALNVASCGNTVLADGSALRLYGEVILELGWALHPMTSVLRRRRRWRSGHRLGGGETGGTQPQGQAADSQGTRAGQTPPPRASRREHPAHT